MSQPYGEEVSKDRTPTPMKKGGIWNFVTSFIDGPRLIDTKAL
jgi:hypothetical protein